MEHFISSVSASIYNIHAKLLNLGLEYKRKISQNEDYPNRSIILSEIKPYYNFYKCNFIQLSNDLVLINVKKTPDH